MLTRQTALIASLVMTTIVPMLSYGMLKGDYLPHQFCFGGDKLQSISAAQVIRYLTPTLRLNLSNWRDTTKDTLMYCLPTW